jgi:DNA-binding Lrp family transcriptional regulator
MSIQHASESESQHKKLLEALKAGKRMTVREIETEIGISGTAVPRRIKDLKAEGHTIIIEKVKVPTRHNTKLVSVSRYYLEIA